jgi:hypothetical protein
MESLRLKNMKIDYVITPEEIAFSKFTTYNNDLS